MAIPLPTNAFSAVPRGGIPHQTPYGILSAPGSRVAAYVRSGGVQDGDDDFIANNLVTTLNDALDRCRSGLGDTVYVLPGHAENVDAADDWSNLVAGTNIVGIGQGTLRPTFTWTVAAATVLFDVANVSISNCILKMGGTGATVTVAAPLTISAAGCGIYGCDIQTEVDADSGATIAITTTAAADNLTLIGNHVHGDGDGTLVTTFMDIIGCDDLYMADNVFQGISSVAVGVVRFATTASLRITLVNNVYINKFALSTCAVTGLAAVSGVSINEHFHYLDTSSLTGWLTSTGIMTFHRPTVSNTAGETGSEVVGTVSA